MKDQAKIKTTLTVSLIALQSLGLMATSAVIAADSSIASIASSSGAESNEIHAGGINISAPSLLAPAGGSTDPGIISPGAVAPAPSSLPTINPQSLANQAQPESASSVKPEIKFYGPDGDSDVETKFGNLHVSGGSLVLAVTSEDSLSLYDLHDGRDKSVYITADNQKFSLVPGGHITIAHPRSKTFAAVNRLPFVAYQSADFQQIDDALICFHGTYDINSLIFRFAPFKTLLNSKDPKVRRVAENVVKTAVVINQYATYRNYQQGKPVAGRSAVSK
jgi:hypothetical protein